MDTWAAESAEARDAADAGATGEPSADDVELEREDDDFAASDGAVVEDSGVAPTTPEDAAPARIGEVQETSSDEFSASTDASDDSQSRSAGATDEASSSHSQTQSESDEQTFVAGTDEGDSNDGEPHHASSTGQQDGPFGPGSAEPNEDGSAPSPEFTIKGNADSMLFHTPDSPGYEQTEAEVWFTSEDAAKAAMFRHWDASKR